MAEKGSINIADASDLKKIFDGNYVPLCLFAEEYLSNPEDAADSVQDAFVKLWQRRSHFDNLNAAKAFLYTTIRNDTLNRLAHNKVEGKYNQWYVTCNDDHFFHDHLIEQECFHLLREAIHALPDQTRKVMLLALEGKDNETIATALGMAKGTVHTHKKIAYKRLREGLKDIYPFALVWLSLIAGE